MERKVSGALLRDQKPGKVKGRPDPGRKPNHFIKEWRKARGFNIPQLAEKTGYGTSLISQIEVGRSRYSQKSLEAIAEALGVPPGLLLCWDPANDNVALFLEARQDPEMKTLDADEKAMLSNSINTTIKVMLDQFAKGAFDKK